MKIKVSATTNTQLDRLVAKCEGRTYGVPGTVYEFQPSTRWAHGGPIIERVDINVTRLTHSEVTESGKEIYRKDGWTAYTTAGSYWVTPTRCNGPTPLIAAMRCYVASKFGDTVDIPDELT